MLWNLFCFSSILFAYRQQPLCAPLHAINIKCQSKKETTTTTVMEKRLSEKRTKGRENRSPSSSSSTGRIPFLSVQCETLSQSSRFYIRRVESEDSRDFDKTGETHNEK